MSLRPNRIVTPGVFTLSQSVWPEHGFRRRWYRRGCPCSSSCLAWCRCGPVVRQGERAPVDATLEFAPRLLSGGPGSDLGARTQRLSRNSPGDTRCPTLNIRGLHISAHTWGRDAAWWGCATPVAASVRGSTRQHAAACSSKTQGLWSACREQPSEASCRRMPPQHLDLW